MTSSRTKWREDKHRAIVGTDVYLLDLQSCKLTPFSVTGLDSARPVAQVLVRQKIGNLEASTNAASKTKNDVVLEGWSHP